MSWSYWNNGTRVVAGKRCKTCNVVGANAPFNKEHQGHDIEDATIGRRYKDGGHTNEFRELPEHVLRDPNTVVATMQRGNQWRGKGAKSQWPGTWISDEEPPKSPKWNSNFR